MTIYLEKDAEGFDLDSEILCTLPCYPNQIPLATIVDDFGLTAQSDVREILAKLREKHQITLRVFNDNGVQVSVPRRHWERVQEASEEYWDSMYAPDEKAGDPDDDDQTGIAASGQGD